VNFDWTQLSFIIGNLVGALIKGRPNLGIWKDKYIPAAIFVVMLVVQFLNAALQAATQPATPVVPAEFALAGFSLGKIGLLFWEAFKQAGIAVLLNQGVKQAQKQA